MIQSEKKTSTVLVAGGTGDLGGRIINSLLDQGAEVRALVRSSSDRAKIDELEKQGVKIFEADFSTPDLEELTQACEGVSCVVSALQGLRDVIVDAQAVLLEAAVAAGVPRFIPSDYSSDFTRLPAGENRNFDLRREFHERLDRAEISPTSIFNGAFANILTYNIPVLDFKKKSVGYWGDTADRKLDFTTRDDTAAFTAAAALDEAAPKSLLIASFRISPRELAALASEIAGTDFQLVRMGSLDELAAYNKRERAAHPEGESQVFPRWQSTQYIQSMFSVQNETLDNDRYPGLKWTRDVEFLTPVFSR